MPMNSPQDLFLHELGDMYDAEQRIVQILLELASEAGSNDAKQAYQQHERETRQQVQNLDQCFQLLGSKPQRQPCYAVEGLKKEHDSFKNENPSEMLLTMFDLGAASKTEHYEIASYEGLIAKAQLMGQQQVAQLLQQNLQQEQAMAQRVSSISKQLGQQAAGRMSRMSQPDASTTYTAQP